jgi:YD repeat-containing protein
MNMSGGEIICSKTSYSPAGLAIVRLTKLLLLAAFYLLGFAPNASHALLLVSPAECAQNGGSNVCPPLKPQETWTTFSISLNYCSAPALTGAGPSMEEAVDNLFAQVPSECGTFQRNQCGSTYTYGSFSTNPSDPNAPNVVRIVNACGFTSSVLGTQQIQVKFEGFEQSCPIIAATPLSGNFTQPYQISRPFYCEIIPNPKILGKSDCCVGNPVDPRTGNKFQEELDLSIPSPSKLEFRRYYNSKFARIGGALGNGWRHSYDRAVSDDSSGTTRVVLVSRADGKVQQFRFNGQLITADTDVPDRLELLANGGWKYTGADADEVELYDATGRLLSIQNRVGQTQSLTYDGGGNLSTVTDSFGRTLSFAYDAWKRIATMTDSASRTYTYGYSADDKNNLVRITYPDASFRIYHYENAAFPNALTGITDENGDRFATWTYGSSGAATSSEHWGGAEKSTLSYFSSTRTDVMEFVDSNPVTSITRAYQFTTTAGVPKLSGINFACNTCGPQAKQYNTNGFVSKIRDWNSHDTNFTRSDANGRADLETLRVEGAGTPAQRSISTIWHPNFRLPVQIAEPLKITSFVYNGDGGVTCGMKADGVTAVPGVACSMSVQGTSDTTGALGFGAAAVGAPRTWAFTYNSLGQVLSVNGPRLDVTDVTTYAYDAQGNLTTIEDALGHVAILSDHNAYGRPLRMEDANGLVTILTYDARQRLLSRELGGEVTTLTYDPVGQLVKVTLPDQSFVSYTYDPAHRLTAVTDSLGNKTSYTLDQIGNHKVDEIFDPSNLLVQTRSRLFSNQNRLSKEFGAEGQVTEYGYDGEGAVTVAIAPLNRTTRITYDGRNRPIQVTNPALGMTTNGYDSLDRLIQVTDPRSRITTYAIDGLGNLNQQVSPDTGTTVNTYDPAGNILTQTDAKSQLTTYAYDALNRVTLISFYEAGAVPNTSTPREKHAYAYDQGPNGIGRLSTIMETNSANQQMSLTAYAYDSHGRVTSETRTVAGIAYVVGYSYDMSGRLSGMTYPSGRVLAYAFDSLGRVSQVTATKDAQSQVVVQSVAYHPFGGVKSYTLGNGQIYSRTVDHDGRIASYTLGASDFQVSFDAASRITGIAEVGVPANANTYGYDTLDRLTSVVLPNSSFGYGYDAVGNRTSKATGAASDIYAYSATSNRIASLTPATGPVRNFTLDSNGSTTNDGLNTYTFDTKGRMTQATSSAGTTTYQVNALGQRIRKSTASTDTVFHYDSAGRLVAETAPDGSFKRDLIYLGDIPVAVVQ